VTDRDRSRVFGDDADAYDRTRPGYPAELIDWLVGGSALDVLDVGCGTGKLSRLLAGRGCRVLGVEPDQRMAAVARGHALDVEVSTFEAWVDTGRRYDLVTSAQAWHWVDPVVGARRAADVLRPGGRLAVVWNLYAHEPAVGPVLDDVYERLGPSGPSVVLGVAGEAEPLAGVDATAAFGPQSFRHDDWAQTYTTAQWLDQLPTHSDHRLLDPARRAALLAAVGEVVDANGGHLTISYTTRTITAIRL